MQTGDWPVKEGSLYCEVYFKTIPEIQRLRYRTIKSSTPHISSEWKTSQIRPLWPRPWVVLILDFCHTSRDWYSPWAGTHRDLVLTMSWYSPWAGTHHELVLTMSWHSPWAGTHRELVLTVSWYSSWAGTHLELVLTVTWYSPWAGTHHKLIITVSWYSP